MKKYPGGGDAYKLSISYSTTEVACKPRKGNPSVKDHFGEGRAVKNVTNANGFVVVEVVVAAAAPGTSFAVKRCCENVRNASLHSGSRK